MLLSRLSWLSVINFKDMSWGCFCSTWNYRDSKHCFQSRTLTCNIHTHTHTVSHIFIQVFTHYHPTEFLPCRAVYHWSRTELWSEKEMIKLLFLFIFLQLSLRWSKQHEMQSRVSKVVEKTHECDNDLPCFSKKTKPVPPVSTYLPTGIIAWNLRLKQLFDSPIGSSGWKATSLTEPAWPGSLYRILRDVVSHMYTNLSIQT